MLEPRNKYPVFAIALFISYLFISCMLVLLSSLYARYIFVFTLLYAWGLFANTSIQPREPTRHLNSYLEESWGVSPEPFTGNPATLLSYTLCV